MRRCKIGHKWVGEEEPCFIVAEVGTNHQGQIDLAKKLIEIAVDAGADAVKFQKRNVNRILTKHLFNMPYRGNNSFGKTYGEHRRALELSEATYYELKRCAEGEGIIFFASAWDEESADFLEELDVPAFKIASADVSNLPLIEHIAKKGKTVILSTGMSTMCEVEMAVETVKKFHDQVAVLQCASTYPSKFEEINLRVIENYRDKFRDCVIGYSGHELGIAITVAAVALGAKIVERHFTIDRTMKGSDHAASLEPQGLSKMIRDIRALEKALGTSNKEIQNGELAIRRKLAKSVASAMQIPKDTLITREMLIIKGPGTGISPARIDEVVGKKTSSDIKEDVVILEENIKW